MATSSHEKNGVHSPSSMEGEFYIVEKILAEDEAVDDNEEPTEELLYFVKWQDYPIQECTWEPRENFEGEEPLQEWERKKSSMDKATLEEYMDRNVKKAHMAKERDLLERSKLDRAKKRKRVVASESEDAREDDSDDIPLLSISRQSQPAMQLGSDDSALSNADTMPAENHVDGDIDLRKQGVDSPVVELFIKENPVAHHGPFDQSSSEDEENKPTADVRTERHGSNHVNIPSHQITVPNLGSSILSLKKANQAESSAARTSTEDRPGLRKCAEEAVPTCSASNSQPESASAKQTSVITQQRKNSSAVKSQPIHDKIHSPETTNHPTSISVTATASSVDSQHGSRPGLAKTSKPAVESPKPAAESSKPATAIPVLAKPQVVSRTSSTNIPTGVANPAPKRTTQADTTSKPTLATRLPSGDRNSRRTAPGQPIRMTSAPKTKRKEWRNSEGLFKRAHFLGTAQKRSRAEQEPAHSALEFVHGEPAGIRKAADTPVQQPTYDNPYGRREMPLRRVVEEDDYQRPLVDKSTNKASKIPMVCYFWRMSSSCRYTPESCPFMHQNLDANGKTLPIGPLDARIPGKYRDRPQTCWYWFETKEGCARSAEDCFFAHWNTGLMAVPGHDGKLMGIEPHAVAKSESNEPDIRSNRKNLPRKQLTCCFWKRGSCNKTQERCPFSHHDTGIVADPPPGYGAVRPARSLGNLSEPSRLHTTSNQPVMDVNHNATNIDEVLGVVPSPTVTAIQSKMNSDVPREHSELTDSLVTNTKACSTTTLLPNIANALKVDIAWIFASHNEKNKSSRRVFLLYHPEEHFEELELTARYFLMHGVEVSCPWVKGSWRLFVQRAMTEDGSNIIFAHPDFEAYADLPGFGQLLRKQHVKLWSLGVQQVDARETTPSPPAQHADTASTHQQACIKIFPVGGFIYITDEIFNHKPQLALKIVELFSMKIDALRSKDGKLKPLHSDGVPPLLWRLCVRPELMEHLYQTYEDRIAEVAQMGGNLDLDAMAELYKFCSVSEIDLIEQDGTGRAFDTVADWYPILSERRIIADDPVLDYFNAVARSQSEANHRMIRYYAALQVDMRRKYRQFFVVHTEPSAPCVAEWTEDVKSISGVITPEHFIRELEKSGKESLFNFQES